MLYSRVTSGFTGVSSDLLFRDTWGVVNAPVATWTFRYTSILLPLFHFIQDRSSSSKPQREIKASKSHYLVLTFLWNWDECSIQSTPFIPKIYFKLSSSSKSLACLLHFFSVLTHPFKRWWLSQLSDRLLTSAEVMISRLWNQTWSQTLHWMGSLLELLSSLLLSPSPLPYLSLK